MALLLERSIINFPMCYKFIIVVILLMVHNQGTNSSEVNLKDSVYIDNSRNKSDYISDVIRRYKRQNINSGVNCKLPSNPLHGRYALLGDSVTSYKPGDFANEFRNLEIHCNVGYALSPLERNMAICINGSWNPPPTACLRTCTSLSSTETTTVKCSFNNIPLKNCIAPVVGTRAALSCNPMFEEPNIQKSPIRVCRGNRWNPQMSTCYPICGYKNPKGNPNIIGGQNATIGDYPWQIGIYNSTTKAFICGGSIIEQNIILTAAHCVTNYDGVVEPTSQYSVAAGKYFSRYDEPRDLFAQYSKVLTIHVPGRYTGLINSFDLDIAVLILEIQFTLSEGIQPICIALNDDSSDVKFLSASDNGIVTGWGFTIENGSASEVLKELIIPIIPSQKCSSEVPENFRMYFSVDKICGGYLNNRTSICTGDSGSALVFKNVIDNRYYARGIVSTSPATKASTCDPNQYSFYTSVDKHINFVQDLIIDNQFRTPIECFGDSCQNEEIQMEQNQEITSTNCRIPNYGHHVRYAILGESGNAYQIPGADVLQHSTLEIICDQGYKPNVFSDLRTVCVNGKWVPSLTLRCLRTCPSLKSTTSTRVTCIYHDIPLKKCHHPIEGTKALLLCKPFYEEDALQKNVIRTCVAGEWIPAISKCHPMCGVKRPKGRPNIINSLNATMENYPWHVAIYSLTKMFICSGSILNLHIILTAALCVTEPSNGKVLGLENFHIAAGKNSFVYDDPIDEFAQYSKVLQIHVPSRYRGGENFLSSDIAAIILSKPFTISEAVQPICIVLDKETPYLHLSLNSSGLVTGWRSTQENSSIIISEGLKEFVVPIIPFDKCFEELPEHYQIALSSDKICTGYFNNGTSNCIRGDIGAALVLKNILNERYYIEGIVSVPRISADGISCYSNYSHSLHTSILEHIDFLKNLLAQYQMPESIEYVEDEATN